jgi:hypothetical protein
MNNTNTIQEFLALPVEALPGASFYDDEDSWAFDPWEVLRVSANTGASVADLCGTKIVLTAG